MKFRSGNTHQNKKIGGNFKDWPKHGEKVQRHCCTEKIQGQTEGNQ